MNDEGKSTASAYGVKGIPAKVIIDQNGFIRFQNAGAGVEKIVNDLTVKIELARKG